MAILLRESDVEKLASMSMAIQAVEHAFKLQGEQKAENAPRRRCRLDHGMLLHTMSASLPPLGYAGLKSYTSVGEALRFMVSLYKEDGTLAAMIEANKLSQLRTAAASAVATKYMAREKSSKLGVFGAGFQAFAQIAAICSVRPIDSILVYSRNAAKCAAFCKEVSVATGIKASPAASPETAVREMDVIVTATNSSTPVFMGEWLPKGVHINAIGATYLSKQELDIKSVEKCSCVVVDSYEQAQLESGDLAKAAEAEAFYWEDARELGLVVVGEFPGREDDAEITLFESQGIALEDVALASKIYDEAVKSGIGETLPF
jgi:alanine dehydrogenase